MIRRPGLTDRLSVGAAEAAGARASRPPMIAAAWAMRGTGWGSFLEAEGRERERGRVGAILHERHRPEGEAELPRVACARGGAEAASDPEAARRRDARGGRDVERRAGRDAE